MPGHLTFRDDATEEFLAAFEVHQSLTTANGERPQLRTAVNGIRSLALALEKACKDAVASIDPYLLINKLDRALLVEFRDGSSPTGVVSGRIESISSSGASVARTIAVSGTAILDSEWHIVADPNKIPPQAERTTRAFELSVRLAAGDS